MDAAYRLAYAHHVAGAHRHRRLTFCQPIGALDAEQASPAGFARLERHLRSTLGRSLGDCLAERRDLVRASPVAVTLDAWVLSPATLAELARAMFNAGAAAAIAGALAFPPPHQPAGAAADEHAPMDARHPHHHRTAPS